MPIELTVAARTQFKTASRAGIGDYFVAFPPHSRRARWLPQNNRYRVDCVTIYKDDTSATPPTVHHAQIAQYIAASGPTHAVDGWSFLGRAVNSLLRGDGYSAIHFAYYAELRAAMGLLATEGFGVLNQQHPVVSGPALTAKFAMTKGTHAIVVPTLKYWSTLSRARDLLDLVVRPEGIALSAWLDACGAQARSRAIARAWLKIWGVDLSQVDQDHDARNLVSYRPSELRRPSVAAVDQMAAFVRDLWNLFEPSPNFRFPSLEANLLRLALQDCGIGQPTAAAIEGLGFTNVDAANWAARLGNPNVALPLAVAKNVSPIESDQCAMQVIARAAMLLFVATRSASIHLSNAGYTRDDLSFWWKRFGIDRSLWADDAVPDDPRDAWADMHDALDDLDESLAAPVPTSSTSWRRKLGVLNRSADDFAAWELVAIWGLVP